MRLGLTVLLGCAPEGLVLEPAEGSAAGGEEVVIRGDNLGRTQIEFGEVDAEILEQGDREVRVLTPPGFAGPVQVRAQRGRRSTQATFVYLPVELGFLEAASHYLPQPETALRDAAQVDLDGDGRSEIVVVDTAGALGVWRNGGQGAFVQTEGPVVEGAQSVVGWDDAIWVCAGGLVHRHGLEDTDWVSESLELPCASLAVADGVVALTAEGLTWLEGGAVAAEGPLAVSLREGGAVYSDASGLHLLDGELVAASGLPDAGCAAGALETLDTDGDGLEEILATCPAQDRLYRQDGAGIWFDDTALSLPVDAAAGIGVAVEDLDRDGLPEVLVANGDGVDRLLISDGWGYSDGSARLGLHSGQTVGLFLEDVDGDGDTDVLQIDALAPRLYLQVSGD